MSLKDGLRELAASLPRGSRFDWELDDGTLHLSLLRVPKMRKGVGTRFLADVLALADAHAMPVTLDADPSLEPDEPSLFDLVRTYMRFGFVPEGMTEDNWVTMARPPRPVRDGSASVLADYAEGRRSDLDRDRYDVLLRGWLADLADPHP